MSAFGAKRKPRIIRTLDDDAADQEASTLDTEDRKQDQSSQVQRPIKFGRRPAKSSSLRKSINLNDDDDDDGNSDGGASVSGAGAKEDPRLPVVVRPSIARPGSTKQKKKTASSRLSFGPGEGAEDDDAGTSALKKTLGRKALENNATKKGAALHNLPTRFLGSDDDRPRYSKEYLDELQSSTPNTPQNLSSLRITDDDDGADEMALDPSELDGATVVQTSTTEVAARSQHPAATVLTDGQIREKKERRTRRALEADFISLDDDDEGGGGGSDGEAGPVSVRFEKSSREPPSRLVAEDEDLGEGYDEFVEDGGLSLGRKAEREARRRHRREMAEMIHAAEEGSDADSDDSEAERRAAYEAAQRRAGMDGLQRLDGDGDVDGAGLNVIPKMRPLPDLNESVQRMHNLVQGLEDEVTRKRKKIAEMEKEKEEILQREREVQEILDQAGAKYQSLAGTEAVDVAKLATTQSPLRPVPPGLAGDLPVERGLESFGTTPTTRPDIEMD